MGEARFSIKATFPTPADAEAARDWLCRLIDEDAEKHWQEHRHEPANLFWPAFQARHPLTVGVLSFAESWNGERYAPVVPGESSTEDLCGLIDWQDNVLPDETRPTTDGRNLTYQAVTWYWARWAPLATALVKRGAEKVVWESPQGRFVMDCMGEYTRAA